MGSSLPRSILRKPEQMANEGIWRQVKDWVVHDPSLYTDEENLRWCWLRSCEWGEWPLFIGQLIAPLLFLKFPWWYVTVALIVLSWGWILIRYKFVSIMLVGLGPFVIILKWPVSIGIGIYFLINGRYLLGVVSALWPVITLVLMLLTPTTKIGAIQIALMSKLGYVKKI